MFDRFKAKLTPAAPPPVVREVYGVAPIRPEDYETIRRMVYEHSRINLGENKRELVMARLSKRLRALGLDSYQAYCRYLTGPKGEDELADLIDVISTNHTFFFREADHFDYLTKTVMPGLLAEARPGSTRQIQIWSAACSSGEEPYSIAISLLERVKFPPGWSFRILCTDISRKVLAKAQSGVFPEERLQTLPPDLLKRYFEAPRAGEPGVRTAKAELRKYLSFQRLNLLQARYPFTGPFEVAFCRNVMIYFDRPTQQELVNKIAGVMAPAGHLFIGHAESLTGVAHPLRMLQPSVFRKP